MKNLVLILLCFAFAESFDLYGPMMKCVNNFKDIYNTNSRHNLQKYCFDSVMSNHPRFGGWIEDKTQYRLLNLNKPSNSASQLVLKGTRKEYRMLSLKERYDFNRAINLLKQDKSLSPNVYDAIAFLHAGDTARNAHAGPSFLVWHRIYLNMMEEALNEKVPGIVIPYWDPTLDSSLSDPRHSILWTDEFLGNINGIVNSGPFANWSTPAGPLIRNGGFISNLPTRNDIKDVLSKRRLQDITEPNAVGNYLLEFHHNSIHNFVGGHLGQIETSAMDPVFWLIHSYIDLIMTRFNENQRKYNIDPATDYPVNYGLPIYAPDQSIGLKNITIKEALKLAQTKLYTPKYDHAILDMKCFDSSMVFPSPYITCKNGEYQTKTRPSTRCGTLIPYQNLFCINNKCDLNEWAFIPIEVIYERPYETMKFGNFPVVNGHPNLLNDIYDNNLPQNSTSGNSTCRRNKCSGAAGRLNIQASGINYFGNYEEMVIVDRRLAVSSDIAYIGIRNPEHNESLVFMTASEQCGRICRPSCLVEGSNPPRYTPCIGLLNITRNHDKFFGKSLADIYMKIWDYSNQIRPKLRHEHIPIVFHCDDSQWPFTNSISTTTTIWRQTTATTKIPTIQPTTTTTQPTTTTTQPTIPTTQPTTTTTFKYDCRINDICMIQSRCSCRSKQQKPCLRSCSRYSICIYGKYFVFNCGPGFRYDPFINRCVQGFCQE
ncbi:uncharacterized protein LOC115209318 [Argonauta hians]